MEDAHDAGSAYGLLRPLIPTQEEQDKREGRKKTTVPAQRI